MQLIKATIMVLLFAIKASGQNPQIDSLEVLLKKHPQVDTTRVKLLNALAYETFKNDLPKAQACAREAREISSKLDYPRGEAASLYTTGLTLMQHDKEEAVACFRKALKIAEKIDDKVGICNYLTAIGGIAVSRGDLETSNEVYQQALQAALVTNDKSLLLKCRINIAKNKNRSGEPAEAAKQYLEVVRVAEELADQAALSSTYASLGILHLYQGNLPTALEYYLLSLKISETRGDDAGIINCLVNIAGIQSDQNEPNAALATINKALQLATEKRDSMQMSVCYTNIGNIYHKINHPKALGYFQKALPNSDKIGQTTNILLNMGAIYTERGEFEAAMENLNEALVLAQKAKNPNTLGQVYIKIGGLYLKQKKYSQAKEYIQQALSFAEKTNYTELQKDCYEWLSKIYAATGDFKSAYNSHMQYKSLHDKLFNEENTRKIALLESSYQFDKERAVYELEKSRRELRIKGQRQTILSLVVISLLVILLAFVIYLSERLKKKVLRLEIENINRELEANQKAMAVAKLKLVQNSERDAHTIKMLEEIGKNTIGEQRNISSLINDYKLQTNHSNWEEFETLFTKVNTSFWDKLNESYPTLTPNERKLCVFLKLNMSNKDIALITLQSEEALKKSRLRLRGKLNIDRSVNLSAFIQNL